MNFEFFTGKNGKQVNIPQHFQLQYKREFVDFLSPFLSDDSPSWSKKQYSTGNSPVLTNLSLVSIF